MTAVLRTDNIPDLGDPSTYEVGIPHEAFDQLRRTPGLYWQRAETGTANGGFWAVTRYADIAAIEKDPLLFSSEQGAAYPIMNVPADNPLRDLIMLTDPPRHTGLRKAASTGFIPRVVANFEPWVREIVQDACKSVVDLDEFDFVEKFASVIPGYVVARVLGSPKEHRDRIAAWAHAFFAAQVRRDDVAPGEGTANNGLDIMAEMAAYAIEIQEIKKREPADDMFTQLTQCVERGELTQNEFLMWIFLMINAGYETTYTAMGQSTFMYMDDPEIRRLTERALDEDMIGRAVDGYLRVVTPVIQMGRTVTSDTEVGGTQVHAGDVMVLFYSAANRDPEAYSEPDKFDPWRAERHHLSFGMGVHRCLGAHLAKLEMTMVWEELRDFGINLEISGTPKRGWSNFSNQLVELPVRKA